MKLINQGLHRLFASNYFILDVLDRGVDRILRSLSSSRFVFHSIGKVRRLGLVHFKKQYVKKQLAMREGECRQCGTCCNLLFTCPSLTTNGKCITYGVCRPDACKVFPIDQRDIDEVALCGKNCGYRFKSVRLHYENRFIRLKRTSGC